MNTKPSIFIWQNGFKGGAEKVTIDYANGFNEYANISPVLGIFQGEESADIPFRQIEVPRLFPKKYQGLNNIWAAHWLKKKKILQQFDLVFTHSGAGWKTENNFYIHFEPGDLKLMEKALPAPSKYLHFIVRLFLEKSFKKADLILSASRKADKYFDTLNIKYISTNNIVNTENINQINLSKTLGDPITIIFIGRNDRIKNLNSLIRAVNIQNKRNIQLKIIGLSGQDNVNIKYLDWCTQEQISEELINSDIFCLPSIYEASPLVVLEALALGIPCIVNKNAIQEELIEFVEICDINWKDIYQSISQVIHTYEDYHQKALLSHKIIKQHFSKKNIIDNVRLIIEKINGS